MIESPTAAESRVGVAGVIQMVYRGVFVLICFILLGMVGYGIENWRGQRAWERCQRELRAKGLELDWNKYIPAPVRDEGNFFMAPRMVEWFVRSETNRSPSGKPFEFSMAGLTNGLVLAEVEVIVSNTAPAVEKMDGVLKLNDPTAPALADRVLVKSLGPSVASPNTDLELIRSWEQIKPAHLGLEAKTMPAAASVAALFPRNPSLATFAARYDPQEQACLTVTCSASNKFKVAFKPAVCSATDFLARTEPLKANLELVRNALQRPHCRINTDYQRPFNADAPYFIGVRYFAFLAVQRAQCHLLLGQPQPAWQELSVAWEFCRVLDDPAKPKGTLYVQAMIDVAVLNICMRAMHDGLRLGVWREAELVAMQEKLASPRLLALLAASMRVEAAAMCQELNFFRSELRLSNVLGYDKNWNIWQCRWDREFVLSVFGPLGWRQHNMCALAKAHQDLLEVLDVARNQVQPHQIDAVADAIQKAAGHETIFTISLSMWLPSYERTIQNVARYQTLANHALIACALERYRLAHGAYPERLEALVPQYLEKVPHDIVGGQALKYSRTPEGKYLLYSLGWNEKDDGGVVGKTRTDGDWVWE